MQSQINLFFKTFWIIRLKPILPYLLPNCISQCFFTISKKSVVAKAEIQPRSMAGLSASQLKVIWPNDWLSILQCKLAQSNRKYGGRFWLGEGFHKIVSKFVPVVTLQENTWYFLAQMVPPVAKRVPIPSKTPVLAANIFFFFLTTLFCRHYRRFYLPL